MPRTIDMGIMALGTLIFHMRRGNRDAARLFFRRFINLIKRDILRQALFRQHLRHRRGQRGFAMIDMPDRPHVDMRFGALKLRFRHPSLPFPPTPYEHSICRIILRTFPSVGCALWAYILWRAHDRTRTDDLFLTKEVLYLLSYVGPKIR